MGEAAVVEGGGDGEAAPLGHSREETDADPLLWGEGRVRGSNG